MAIQARLEMREVRSSTFQGFPPRLPGGFGLLASPQISRDEALGILTSPADMLDFFQGSCPFVTPNRMVLEECRPEILRWRQDSRQVIAYRLLFRDRTGQRQKPFSVVLKRFADRTRGKNEYLALRLLRRRGFSEQAEMKVPRPFCYLEDLGLLVEERVGGRLLRTCLGQNTPAALNGMRTAARWLARLHRLRVREEDAGLHPDDGSFIDVLLNRMEKIDPSRVRSMEHLGRLILKRLSSSEPLPFSFAHGDFQGENILLAPGRVSVIDFGRFCRSDPARDLGYMIAQGVTMAALDGVRPRSVGRGLKTFWEAYLASRPLAKRDRLSERSCAYAALKFLDNIVYILAFSLGKQKGIASALERRCLSFAGAEKMEEILAGL